MGNTGNIGIGIRNSCRRGSCGLESPCGVGLRVGGTEGGEIRGRRYAEYGCKARFLPGSNFMRRKPTLYFPYSPSSLTPPPIHKPSRE